MIKLSYSRIREKSYHLFIFKSKVGGGISAPRAKHEIEPSNGI